MMNDLPGNYDAWKTGPFGRFEHAEERRGEAYSEALSERDSDLRQQPDLLAEVFGEAITVAPIATRLESILEAAACHRPAIDVGYAFGRLVEDIITADARRFAEEQTR